MTTYHFKEIKIRAIKSGACASCGKVCSRVETFWQTINPYNKNANGDQKSENEIREELALEASEWRKLPLFHVRCQ